MKSFDEKTHSVFNRIEEEKEKQLQQRKSFTKVAMSGLSFCLVAVIGFTVWKSGALNIKTTVSDNEEYSDSGNQTENNNPADKPADNEQSEQIISDNKKNQKGTDADTDNYVCIFLWNDLSIGGTLYRAITDYPEGVYSVLASYRPSTAEITSFSYEGKTLSEWAIAFDNEKQMFDRLEMLMKLGDDLKYGAELYENGTPSGEKWAESYYKQTVSYIGEELIEKYIVNGEFLRDELVKDLSGIIVTLPDGTTSVVSDGKTEVREKYSKAYNAYMEIVIPDAIAQIEKNGIKCERAAYQNNALIMYVSADQLKTLSIDDLGHWYFELSSDELKGVSDN